MKSCFLSASVVFNGMVSLSILKTGEATRSTTTTTSTPSWALTRRSLAGDPGGNDDHPNSWCHCDGPDVIHCDNEASEQVCECHDHGGVIEVHCQTVDSSCHCDGTVIHCSSETDETVASAMCQCHEGTLECIGDEEKEGGSSSSSNASKPWGQVIVTALLVNVVTLAGLFVVVGEWTRNILCPNRVVKKETVTFWRWNFLPMFATGALFATAFFLMLPEALVLIQSGFSDGHDGHNHRRLREVNPESAVAWRWGASIIGGALVPYVAHSFFPHDHSHDKQKSETETDTAVADNIVDKAIEISDGDADSETEETMNKKDDNPAEEETTNKEDNDPMAEQAIESRASNTSSGNNNGTAVGRLLSKHDTKLQNVALLVSLSVSDFCHQFADGVFMGTAWLLCGRDTAIVVALVTVIHEFPHQLADFLMMVHHCGIDEKWALVLNFFVGLASMLGGILVLAVEMTNMSIGIILAIGGGTFLQVGFCECLVTAEGNQKNVKQKLYGFLAFLLGCVPIGLVLLKHEHCHAH